LAARFHLPRPAPATIELKKVKSGPQSEVEQD
jgi:hypothetical protein